MTSIAAHGLPEGVTVPTARGALPLAALRPGDLVLTLGRGPLPLLALLPARIGPATPPFLSPLLVPAHALGNRRDLILPQGQAVLVPELTARPPGAAPLLPIAALAGWRGIRRQPPAAAPGIALLRLCFAAPCLVPVEGGLVCACPGGMDDPRHPALSLAEGRAHLALHIAAQAGRALAQAKRS